VDKKAVSALLDEIAVLLEIKGESPFKTIAYVKAARALLDHPGGLDEIIRETGLKGIKGIGDGIRPRIIEMHETGHCSYYDELRASIPDGLIDMLRVPGLGPKRAKQIYDALGVASIGELLYACNENRLVSLPGLGPKYQQKLIESIAFLTRHAGRFLYPDALAEAVRLRTLVIESGLASRVEIAGSLRRKKETVKDIDILVATDEPDRVSDLFVSLPGVESVTGKGPTKTSVTLASGIAADLRTVTPEQYPYALHHFTGSAEHNTKMRGRAKRLGLKMNEYGLYRGEEIVPCESEEDIFRALGLAYIQPELREDMGEVEAAESGDTPRLIEQSDLVGLFHMHSRYSDGKDEIAEVAEAARSRGYRYIGITDHSKTAAYAGGLKAEDLQRQQAEIDAVNQKYDEFRIFKGAEVDILPDGTLDYPEEILATMDFTVCSIHSKFRMTEEEATARVVKAMDNPYFTIFGHPTGRLLLAREGYPLNMKRVIDAAAERGVAIELNAHPQRLDIDWREMHYARERGVKIAISPDAHALTGFDDVVYGVGIARKGRLGPADVLNTLTAGQFMEFVSAGRMKRTRRQ